MAIDTDILLDYTNKRIYGDPTFLAGSTFYTANQMYTHILDSFDESATMDDIVPFDGTSNVLTYFVTNGWYIQQVLVKHLKGASVSTTGYTGAVQLLILNSSGYTSAVAGDIGKTVTAGGSGVGVLLDYDNTQRKWWIKNTGTISNGATIAITTGTGAGVAASASASGEELFSNVYTVGTIANGNIYVEQNGAILTGWWGTGNNSNHINVLIKVKEAGALINSGLVTIYNRNHANLFDNATVDLSGAGSTPAAIATEADSAAALSSSAIAAYIATAHGGTGVTATIGVTFGSFTADINDNGTNETYSIRVDCSNQPMSIVYQALQWICNKDRTAYSLNSALAPLYKSGNVSWTAQNKNPFGQFAGGKLLFARGAYPYQPGDQNYQSRDTTDAPYSPPSSMSVSITGLVATDRVAVFEVYNGTVKKNQFSLTAQATNSPTIIVSTTIPKDTPTTGFIRAVDVSAGTEQRYQYSGWSGSTFTLTGGNTSVAYTVSDTAYVGYIDEQASGTSITKSGLQYVSDRTVKVRVRNSSSGGNQIIPFEVDATITATGLAVPASRNRDYVIGN